MSYLEIFLRAKSVHIDLQSTDGIEQPKVVLKTQGSNFEKLITDKALRSKVKKLFDDGHHARAVEEAFKYLDNTVLRLSKTTGLSGSALMKKVFSPNNPLIKLNAGISASEQSEQLGYMEIFSGVMTGIRNPRAHDSDWEDTEERAMQLLVLANHLICKVKAVAEQI